MKDHPSRPDPHRVLALALLAALVVCWPSLRAVIEGHLDPLTAAVRFALALTGARLAFGVISHLWHSYLPAPVEEPADDPPVALED